VAEPWDDERITTVGLLFETRDALVCQIADPEVPGPWMEVLLRLARSGGTLRMTDLAAQVRLSTSGLTRLVDRIEAAGLVERRACPTDRRGLNAVLTPAGEGTLRRILPAHLDAIQQLVIEPLGDDRPYFESLLRLLRDATSAGTPTSS
jgi:MarR family 2-MHQ and catechol resistance regulon transcriptional repressor